MDFIEFDSFTADEDVNLPQPQPALSLPLSTNLESFSKKISNFNLSKSFKPINTRINVDDENNSAENELMNKYAELSLNLVKDLVNNGTTKEELQSTAKTDSMALRLSRVFNDPLSDSNLREIFANFDHYDSQYIQKLVDSGFVGTMSRKNLKSKIEHELIKDQMSILKEHQPVIKQLKTVESKLTKLNELNTTTNERVNKNSKSSSEFNAKVRKLNNDKQLIELKKNLLKVFKEKFTLNEYEEFTLTQGEMNDEYFHILKKAEKIVDECSILLSEDNPQLGLKIMSKMNYIMNKSIDRIISYCNKTLDNLYSLSSKTRLKLLHECFQYLKTKEQFHQIIDKFSDTRSKLLLDEFQHQVHGPSELESRPAMDRRSSTKSSLSSGVVEARPIFMSAHDPIRFIGDFLAYVHSIAVNESETISNIFTMGNDDDHEFDETIQIITNKVLKSLSKPIKSKIEQVISIESKLGTIYQIFNLLELYSIMFQKQLRESDNLIITIRNLVTTCQDRIFMIISNKISTISSSNSARLELNHDLQPPEWIIGFYSDILPMIDQMHTKTILNLSEEEEQRFLKLIISQPISIFKSHADGNKHFSKMDSYIMEYNFLDLVRSKIMPISLLSDKALEINDLATELAQKLTALIFENILKKTQLYDYFNILNMICPLSDEYFDVSIYEPIKENKLINSEKLKEVNTILQDYMPNLMIEVQQQLLKLNSPTIVNDIIAESFLKFIKFYYQINQINQEVLNFYFTWSDFDLATMLGVDEIYEKSFQDN
ncbi:COG6 [Candida pseudojiufengensis]|uniref:COG6 n=1 Tax=Candida pseudojiufengensis TaxID=497109 RepID=UPI0022252919|nr:COG6 [Candida pseudojiufengensis]KAI5964686.1 COG6 [Candida pseudojiufengensis]